jgi:hypothetical protein
MVGGGAEPPHEREEAAAQHVDLICWRDRGIRVPTFPFQRAVAERQLLSASEDV